MVIRLAGRAVVARGEPFVACGEVLSDPGVALDEISGLTGNTEPAVLRVVATGGSARDRAKVAGDWLCAADGGSPRRLPHPEWKHNRESAAWSRGRTWLDAWEGCEDARWMLYEACDAGVDHRLITLAACDCARTVVRLVPGGERRPLRAIEAAEAWASWRAKASAVRVAADGAADAANAAASAHHFAAYSAAYAASYAAAVAYVPDVYYRATFAAYAASHAADAHAADASTADISHLRDMADIVRSRVPTLSVLLAACAAG